VQVTYHTIAVADQVDLTTPGAPFDSTPDHFDAQFYIDPAGGHVIPWSVFLCTPYFFLLTADYVAPVRIEAKKCHFSQEKCTPNLTTVSPEVRLCSYIVSFSWHKLTNVNGRFLHRLPLASGYKPGMRPTPPFFVDPGHMECSAPLLVRVNICTSNQM
jgi:hypothetical protein